MQLPRPPRVSPRPLDDKRTPIHRVDDNKAALEVRVVAPSASEGLVATAREVVVLRVDVKVGDLLHTLAGGVQRDGAYVKDRVSEGVVALMGEAVDHELVVVDAAAWSGETAGLLGRPKVGDVPDVGDGVGGLAELGDVDLVVFIIQDEMRLPQGVEHPALVGVGNSLVRGSGDDLDVLLIFNIVARELSVPKLDEGLDR